MASYLPHARIVEAATREPVERTTPEHVSAERAPAYEAKIEFTVGRSPLASYLRNAKIPERPAPDSVDPATPKAVSAERAPADEAKIEFTVGLLNLA